METTLHRQFKELYAGAAAQQEVTLDGFRIDAIADGRLVEIQYGSLGAIRDKIRRLLDDHSVLVVKPLAARKRLVRRDRRQGPVVSSRYSPTRETSRHLFEDLVHFIGVFPHPRLTLEVVLSEQEEERVTTRRRRRFGRDYRVVDRRLCEIRERIELRTVGDLLRLLPAGLPDVFSTGDIAAAAPMPRWLAQKMAYCLRKTGAVETVDKRGNALLYRVAPDRRRTRRGAA